jgi:hypothetical protein
MRISDRRGAAIDCRDPQTSIGEMSEVRGCGLDCGGQGDRRTALAPRPKMREIVGIGTTRRFSSASIPSEWFANRRGFSADRAAGFATNVSWITPRPFAAAPRRERIGPCDRRPSPGGSWGEVCARPSSAPTARGRSRPRASAARARARSAARRTPRARCGGRSDCAAGRQGPKAYRRKRCLGSDEGSQTRKRPAARRPGALFG